MPKRSGTIRSKPDAAAKLALDAHLLDLYLTGLQAEVEAKLRRVNRFREQMKNLDAAGGRTNIAERRRAVDVLLRQVDEMLETNLLVRDTLKELRAAARAVRQDIADL